MSQTALLASRAQANRFAERGTICPDGPCQKSQHAASPFPNEERASHHRPPLSSPAPRSWEAHGPYASDLRLWFVTPVARLGLDQSHGTLSRCHRTVSCSPGDHNKQRVRKLTSRNTHPVPGRYQVGWYRPVVPESMGICPTGMVLSNSPDTCYEYIHDCVSGVSGVSARTRRQKRHWLPVKQRHGRPLVNPTTRFFHPGFYAGRCCAISLVPP